MKQLKRTKKFKGRGVGILREALSISVRTLENFDRGTETLASGAARLHQPVSSVAEQIITGRKRKSSGFPARLSKVILDASERAEGRLTEQSLSGELGDLSLMERLAGRAQLAGDLSTSLALRLAALEMDPGVAHRLVAVGRTLERMEVPGVRRDPTLGVIAGGVGRHDEAVEYYKRALTILPGNTQIMWMLGKARLNTGDQVDGLKYLEMAAMKDGRKDQYLELATYYRRPSIANFTKSLDAYECALAKDPSDAGIVSSIVNVTIRSTLEWRRLWALSYRLELSKRKRVPTYLLEKMDNIGVIFREEPSRIEAEDAIESVDFLEARGHRFKTSTVELLSARLQSLGKMQTGFDLRKGLAKSSSSLLGNSAARSPERLRRLVSALAYTGEVSMAKGVLSDDYTNTWVTDQRYAQVRQKLRGDLAILEGRLASRLEYVQKQALDSPQEDAMRALVEGRRVAVVGPGDTGDELGEFIDSFDVIVRPRFTPEFIADNARYQGKRTDIAYYNGRDASEMYEVFRGHIARGRLKMVASRPASLRDFHEKREKWLRVIKDEFSLYYYGTPLGIPRICYDVASYNPEHIALFNVDMYTGEKAFAPGYREGAHVLGPGSALNDLIISHDLLTDFRLLKGLSRSGRLRGEGITEDVLSMDEGEYVDLLGARWMLRESSS